MKTNLVFRIMAALFLAAALLGLALPVRAAPPNGVDHLRGRWDGVIENLYGDDQPFRLLLGQSGPDPNDPQAALYNGCMAVGDGADFAPVSARVVILGNEKFNLTLFGTVTGGGFVIKLTGLIETRKPPVTDDSAGGAWQTSDGEGDWSAVHHDRREVKCPAVDIGDGLWFFGDTYAAVGLDSEEIGHAETLLESYTNIVSSGMLVNTPDGGIVFVPPFTDIFSPQINFVDNFRYLNNIPGFPNSGGVYTFTLLDVFGQPIPGATAADIWTGCPQDAPRNVSASVNGNGIAVTWDPVPPAPGFDPSGFPPLGFYQIGLNPLSGGDGGYGAGQMLVTQHLIPFADFGGFAPGNPDGFDFGSGLTSLTDGVYFFEVVAFAEAPSGSGGVRLECQIRAWDEQVYFNKSGSMITILP